MAKVNISNQNGATIVEYVILLSLIAVVIIFSIDYLGVRIACTFATVERSFIAGRGVPAMVDIGPGEYRSCS